MTPSPDIRRNTTSDHQRRRLGRWLKEWEAEQILRSGLPSASWPPVGEGGRPLPDVVLAPSVHPRVGQVRLLRPAQSGDPAERPIYVAVMAESPDGFVIAPFGRFAEPAVPGEWQTGLRAMPLRVLCVWNARVVEARLLEGSWRAAVLSAETLRGALELHRHLQGGAPLKSVAERDVGPPLRHPLDPRHVYLEEESALLEAHVAAIESGSSGEPGAFLYEQKRTPLRMAAEGRDHYGSGRKKRKRRRRD